MPLEGHWERQHTPLRRPGGRGGWVFTAVGGGLIMAVVVLLVVVLAGGGSSGPARGCIDVTGPSTTGAGSVHACGDAAERTCRAAEREPGSLARSIRADCRRMHAEKRRGG